MKKFAFLLVLVTVANAQTLSSFNQQYATALKQNPPGVTLTIGTSDGRSTYHRFDTIRIKLTFTSEQLHLYTIELTSQNAAAVDTDFIIQGSGIEVPVHSLANHPPGYVCCDSRRRYLGHSPLSVPDANLNLSRVEEFAYTFDLNTASAKHHNLETGDYAIFAQTRNVMKGWPKSQRVAFHRVSDIVVTSSNVLHITITSDAP